MKLLRAARAGVLSPTVRATAMTAAAESAPERMPIQRRRAVRRRGGGLCGGLAAERVHQAVFEPFGYGDVVLRGDGLQRPACGAERLGACGAFGGVCLHPAAQGDGEFAGEQLVQLFEEEAAVHILFGFHGVRFLQVLHQFLQPFDAVVEP